jgi:hypothetical protein
VVACGNCHGPSGHTGGFLSWSWPWFRGETPFSRTYTTPGRWFRLPMPSSAPTTGWPSTTTPTTLAAMRRPSHRVRSRIHDHYLGGIGVGCRPPTNLYAISFSGYLSSLFISTESGVSKNVSMTFSRSSPAGGYGTLTPVIALLLLRYGLCTANDHGVIHYLGRHFGWLHWGKIKRYLLTNEYLVQLDRSVVPAYALTSAGEAFSRRFREQALERR